MRDRRRRKEEEEAILIIIIFFVVFASFRFGRFEKKKGRDQHVASTSSTPDFLV